VVFDIAEFKRAFTISAASLSKRRRTGRSAGWPGRTALRPVQQGDEDHADAAEPGAGIGRIGCDRNV
jgi:hypothetical protein